MGGTIQETPVICICLVAQLQALSVAFPRVWDHVRLAWGAVRAGRNGEVTCPGLQQPGHPTHCSWD